jgi:nitrogen fixation-related uncharacterized protein
VSILLLQVFVSLVLVAGGLILFFYSVRQKDFEHFDRMALFPLEKDNLERDSLEKDSLKKDSLERDNESPPAMLALPSKSEEK